LLASLAIYKAIGYGYGYGYTGFLWTDSQRIMATVTPERSPYSLFLGYLGPVRPALAGRRGPYLWFE